MRIAFITYEFPPDIPQGGIATYVRQTAIMLTKRGHSIEIFSSSPTRSVSEKIDGIWVHRCQSADPDQFMHNVVNVFAGRHEVEPFDIIESPEIHADALLIKKRYPSLPLVVKLHMALFIQMRLYNFYTSFFTKIRFFLGALKQGKFNYFGKYDYRTDIEYEITNLADAIVSPSISLRQIIIKEWKIKPERIQVIASAFSPPPHLLEMPIEKRKEKVVNFVGKLNVHKGLVSLVKVIPLVVKKHPDVQFRLIGNDSFFGTKGMNMSDYIKIKLKGFEKNYTLLGGLKYEDALNQLSSTNICIFPSVWENFPLVCLESMSAGKAVIGSKEGGMSEMLADGAGIIIDPLNVQQIADAVCLLLSNDDLQLELGRKARTKILEHFNQEVIGKKMELHFQQVINKTIN